MIYNGLTIHSQEGPQQGDPLGQLLFCITIHPLLQSLFCKLKLAYMDDVTHCVSELQLARDVEEVRCLGRDPRLHLNDKELRAY